MIQMKKIFILCLCFAAVLSETATKPPKLGQKNSDSNTDVESVVSNDKSDSSLSDSILSDSFLAELEDDFKIEKNEDDDEKPSKKSKIVKRQIFDYEDYLDYAAYDYYDWVCTTDRCQLCDMLTGSCCDPAVAGNVNCFLPDSCDNNPCLSGGTCVATRTIVDNLPDFACMCRAGLTGKYCQLRDGFDPINFIPPIIPVPMPVPMPGPPPPPSLPPQPQPQQQPAYYPPPPPQPAYNSNYGNMPAPAPYPARGQYFSGNSGYGRNKRQTIIEKSLVARK